MKDLVHFIQESLTRLDDLDRKKIWAILPFQIFLSLLDLMGVILLGTVATLTFNIVSNDSRPTRLQLILREFIPGNLSNTSLAMILTVSAIVVLFAKTTLQTLFLYYFSKFQATIESKLAAKLYNNILDGDISIVNQDNFSNYQYTLTIGVNRFVVGVIGPIIIFVSDAFATILLIGFAFYASPISVIIAILVFGISYAFFNGFVNSRAITYGEVAQENYLEIGENLLESLRGLREIRAYKRESIYKLKFNKAKRSVSLINQKVTWLNGLVKYLLEISILFTGASISLVLIITTDVKRAVTVVALFMIIGFRIIPNLQRLQNTFNSIRISRPASLNLFRLQDEFGSSKCVETHPVASFEKSLERIRINQVSFHFQRESAAINSITFDVESNQTIAIIGESGSGKSTLIDLLSGLYKPSAGRITFEFQDGSASDSPQDFSISYISQNCSLFGENIYQNIALKEDVNSSDVIEIDAIITKLNLTALKPTTQNQSRKIRSDSTNISGGERQRIAIARAMYFNSQLVVLDEPTSSLDRDNRLRVVDYLREINHKKTVVLVTHDDELLTLSDTVLFLTKGEVVFFGPTQEYLEQRSNNF